MAEGGDALEWVPQTTSDDLATIEWTLSAHRRDSRITTLEYKAGVKAESHAPHQSSPPGTVILNSAAAKVAAARTVAARVRNCIVLHSTPCQLSSFATRSPGPYAQTHDIVGRRDNKSACRVKVKGNECGVAFRARRSEKGRRKR